MRNHILFIFATATILAGCNGARPNLAVSANPLPGPAPRGGVRAVRLELREPPAVGTTATGQEILLGGFSGLRYLGETKEGRLRFVTLTDRGPNAGEYEEAGEVKRPFLLPDYQPRLVFLEADPRGGGLKIEKEIRLTGSGGRRVSGLPQKKGQEAPVDMSGHPLDYDPQGGDFEGIGVAADGSFWLSDEYGPSIFHFSREGKLLHTLKPGNGLPKVLENRRLNRGFEGFALYGNTGYAMLQSPLDNPPSEGARNSKDSRIVRIVAVDLQERRTVAQYAYVLEAGKSDKIGDIAVLKPGVLLVVEHDGKAGLGADKKVYRVDLAGATNLQLLPNRIVGKDGSLERTRPEDLAQLRIMPVKKSLSVDLAVAGVDLEKVEGIDVAGEFLAVCTDNDFGLDGELDRKTGLAGMKDEKSTIFLLPKASWQR